MNHQAIYRAYPNAVKCLEEAIGDQPAGVFDADGNQIEIDQDLVDAAAVTIAAEQDLAIAKQNRADAYRSEADPLFFKAQRGESTNDEWLAKIEEIKARYPYSS
jgi:hypothetical protein